MVYSCFIVFISSAFANYSGLTGITISKSVTSIGENALSGCDKVTVYGEQGSYAQEFANANNIPFEAIGGSTGAANDTTQDSSSTGSTSASATASVEDPNGVLPAHRSTN